MFRYKRTNDQIVRLHANFLNDILFYELRIRRNVHAIQYAYIRLYESKAETSYV